jgi:GDP-L-fucose synthase
MINKKSKIYIAGHTGMVGSAVLRKFLKAGYKNILFKKHSELDLLNQKETENFFFKERPEYVVLTAAKVGGIKDNMTHQADFIYQNLQIQNNVIWSAFKSDVKKLLFMGSSCIYPRNSPQPMKEEYFMDGKVEPTNEGYAIAKIAGMKLCEKIFSQYNRCFISCMATNAYGYNDNFKNDSSHVIPALIRRIHEAKIKNIPQVDIWGSGRSRREFIFVDDLADAIYFLMQKFFDNSFVNIGTGSDITIKELAHLIKKVVGYRGKLFFDQTKPDGMPKKLLDVTKIIQLGWKSKVGLRDGLATTYRHYLKTNI